MLSGIEIFMFFVSDHLKVIKFTKAKFQQNSQTGFNLKKKQNTIPVLNQILSQKK